MHATKALDYLVLNASQRLDYRVQRNISLQEWYEGFKPQPIEGEDMGFTKACAILGISKKSFYKLLDEGYFGEPLAQTGKRARVSGINRILERESYLIPVLAFKEIIKEQQYYMVWSTFYNSFKKYFEEGANKNQYYVSISNAAKIIYELRKRKTIIEEWPTLEGLIRESGLNLNPGTMRHYFKRRIREIGGQTITVWTYDARGKKDKPANKIPPDVYEKVLAIEREKQHNAEIGISTHKIAERMDLTFNYIGEIIRGGVRVGILHPLTAKGGIYLLTPEESDLVVSGQVPYIGTLKKREKIEAGLEQIYPNVQISHTAEELWYKVKSGDHQAFTILLGLYEPIISQEANNPIFGMTHEERLMSLYTAFYEIIIESHAYPSKGNIIGALRKKLKQRKIQEAPSWTSLDARLREDSTPTLLDFVDEEGKLNF